MSPSNIFLDHILHSIELMEYYTRDKTKEDFLNSDFIQDAVIRRLKIIGEAVRRLPSDFKDKYPEIPWENIANVGNSLENEEYDLDLIWATIENGVPVLKREILRMNEVKITY